MNVHQNRNWETLTTFLLQKGHTVGFQGRGKNNKNNVKDRKSNSCLFWNCLTCLYYVTDVIFVSTGRLARDLRLRSSKLAWHCGDPWHRSLSKTKNKTVTWRCERRCGEPKLPLSKWFCRFTKEWKTDWPLQGQAQEWTTEWLHILHIAQKVNSKIPKSNDNRNESCTFGTDLFVSSSPSELVASPGPTRSWVSRNVTWMAFWGWSSMQSSLDSQRNEKKQHEVFLYFLCIVLSFWLMTCSSHFCVPSGGWRSEADATRRAGGPLWTWRGRCRPRCLAFGSWFWKS